MAARRGRGLPATHVDDEIGEEHYIVACNYFQLHGLEEEMAEPR